MANIKLIMDTRRAGKDGRYPVRISICKSRSVVYIGTGVNLSVKEWNPSKGQCINYALKTLVNQSLQQKLLRAQSIDFQAQLKDGYDKLTAADIKRLICPEENEKEEGDFDKYFVKVVDSKSPGTKSVYLQTRSRLMAYLGESLPKLNFTDITAAWLSDFDKFLSKTAPSANARSIHLRNIRAVFNSAITDELITCYPFRKFRIKSEPTMKRSLSVDQLRSLFNYPCQEYQRRHIDIFKLVFMFRGINMADLARLKEIRDGRVDYIRMKTHKLYSVKVEPEALEIIERYRGENRLLDILDRYGKHQDYTKRCNRSLQAIGEVRTLPGRGGKQEITPAFPGLTLYWARHTWATIAASLDIPKEVIAAGLGHGSDSVTDIYIRFDDTKVDRANRMILDWVLYAKKIQWNG